MLTEADQIYELIRRIQVETAHLPLTGTGTSEGGIDLAGAKELMAAVNDHRDAARGAMGPSSQCSAGSCQTTHAAAADLAAHMRQARDSHLLARPESYRRDLPRTSGEQYFRRIAILEDVRKWVDAASRAQWLWDHLPMSDPSAVTDTQAQAIRDVLGICQDALTVATPWRRRQCGTIDCIPVHRALRTLAEYHASATRSGTHSTIAAAIKTLNDVKVAQQSVVSAALDEMRDVVVSAASAKRIAESYPPHDPALNLTMAEALALDQVLSFGATTFAVAAEWGAERCGGDRCASDHRALAEVVRVHHEWANDGTLQASRSAAQRLNTYDQAQCHQLASVLDDLTGWVKQAKAVVDATDHITLTGTNMLAADQRRLCDRFLAMSDDIETARARLTPDWRFPHDVDATRAATDACLRFHAEVTVEELPPRLDSLHTRAASWRDTELQALKALHALALDLPVQAAAVLTQRRGIDAWLDKRLEHLRRQRQTIEVAGQQYRLYLFSPDNTELLAALRFRAAGQLSSQEKELFTGVGQRVWALLDDFAKAFDDDWSCQPEACQSIHQRLPAWRQELAHLDAALHHWARHLQPATTVDLDDLTDADLGLGELLGADLTNATWMPADVAAKVEDLGRLVGQGERALTEAEQAVVEAAEVVRHAATQQALDRIDLDVLKAAANGARLRLGPLTAHGLNSVGAMWRYNERHYLSELPGLSHNSAFEIETAADAIYDEVYDLTPARLDPTEEDHGALLIALRRWEVLRTLTLTEQERTTLRRAAATIAHYPHSGGVLIIGDTDAEPAALLEFLTDSVATFPRADGDAEDLWPDFLARPATYLGLLTELGVPTDDAAAAVGDLPEDIVAAVRATELNTDLLRCSLRTYQEFAAKFALVQGHVVIGDEMGLGKTVEALALFAHLAASGHRHFLVVCPAGLVTNWVRETTKHTDLPVIALAGNQIERARARAVWAKRGGVAVASYGTLSRRRGDSGDIRVAALVFDEAHYIKNPAARRTMAAVQMIAQAQRVVLMTGTPLENDVGEFRTLIGHVRPDLAATAPVLLPAKFRAHVAPAYLRRNQEDVLTELPDLIEVDEWLIHTDADDHAYREAVAQRNFVAMRRAGMLASGSAKMARLCDIVAEAEANGRRVIVYSYFLDVLDAVAASLPGEVYGPLTGAVPPGARSDLIDAFGNSPGGAVLVAQINTGGVGLNIQAASVVVICEPQVKPTAEAQAVARAHRMGQVHNVQVHRLLNVDSVDARMREILDSKQDIIDIYAHDSVLVEHAPEAVDASEAELARSIIDAEQQRLFGHVST